MSLSPRTKFMLIQTRNKMDAIRAYINTWLKDPRWYCNSCGHNFGYRETPKPPFTCCEEPQVGRNIDHTRGIIKQNAEIRKTRKNDYGSNAKKNLRFGISLPPTLLRDLEKYFATHYQEKLFENKDELHKFMREFPAFRTCSRV